MAEMEGSAKAGEDRKEMGTSGDSSRHPPHDSENGDQARVGDDQKPAPVLPANASGTDKVPTSDQDQPIDDESMYDGRPESGKDHNG